jgi:hypothetical protein
MVAQTATLQNVAVCSWVSKTHSKACHRATKGQLCSHPCQCSTIFWLQLQKQNSATTSFLNSSVRLVNPANG